MTSDNISEINLEKIVELENQDLKRLSNYQKRESHLIFKAEHKVECDRIIPRKASGDNIIDRLQLLHQYCHNKKAQRDLILIRKHKYRKIWNRHFIKVHEQFEKSKWIWISGIPTLV